MSRLTSRLNALEKRMPDEQEPLVILRCVVRGRSDALQEDLRYATVVGVGYFVRENDETEDDFVSRAYTAASSGKSVKVMPRTSEIAASPTIPEAQH